MLLKFYIYILIIGILNCKGNFNNGNTNSLNPSQLIPFALMGGAASSSSSNSDNSNLIVTDSNGSPLGNHIISFQPTGQVVTSDSNGNISINLPPGIYSATVKDTNGNIIGTYEVTVAENGYTQYLITAGNIGLITNTGAVVYYGVNPSTSAQDSPLISSEGTLLGNNNQPLQNYTIIPQPDLGEIRTGSNGEFSTNLPQGNYNFLVKDPYGNLIGNFSGSVSQEGVSNLSINSGNFSINYGGSSASPQNSISGNIKNTKGQNIYGGSITVQPGNEVINIDYSGNFTSNLSPGTYTFTTKDRLGSVIGTYTALIGEGSVSLMAINSGNIHVTMGGISATPYISASLSNYSGQHLAGYTITSQSGSNSWVTDENGNFSGNLPSGTHTLNVKDPSGNSTGTISLTINEYGNPQASITTGNFIVNTGGLSYYPLELTTITDLQGNPLSNYLVYTQGGTDTATNENGNYSTVLRPGSYYVEIYETSSSYESTGGYNLTIDSNGNPSVKINYGDIIVNLGGVQNFPIVSGFINNSNGQSYENYTLTSDPGNKVVTINSNGGFSGTFESGTYTFTLKDPSGNSAGTFSATFAYGSSTLNNISGDFSVNLNGVGRPAESITLSYPQKSYTFAQDISITPLIPNSSVPNLVGYQAKPLLPSGLQLSFNGTIQGRPNYPSETSTYSITAHSNNSGTGTITPLSINVIRTEASGVIGSSSLTLKNQGNITTDGLFGPQRMAIDSNGGLYVADWFNNRVLYYPSGSNSAMRVYGQDDQFETANENNGGISAKSLKMPTAVALDSNNGVYIADTGNNRVLYYPSGSTTATRVYGQRGYFNSNYANNGGINADSLNSPSGVAVDANGGLYIADTSNNRILYYPPGDTTATRIYGPTINYDSQSSGTGTTNLYRPYGISLDSSGGLYAADQSFNRVLFFPSGSTTTTRVYGQGGSFTSSQSNNGGINADSLRFPYDVKTGAGGVFISDTHNGRVLFFQGESTTASYVYGQDGNLNSGEWNKGGTSAKSLYSPMGIAVDPTNNGLYVSDQTNNRILYFPIGNDTATRVYGQGGDFTTSARNFETSGNVLWYPTAILFDSTNGKYVCDSGNNRVLYFPSGANLPTRVYGQGNDFYTRIPNKGGVSAGSLSNPQGLALDSNNGLYISDSKNNRILYFPSGNTVATKVYGQPNFNSNFPGVSASNLNSPYGITLDSSGGLYVADKQNNRVVYFTQDNTTASVVYGQEGNFTTNTPNKGGISENSLNGPRNVLVDSSNGIYIYDNTRILYYPSGSTTATKVYGQAGNFNTYYYFSGTTASSLSGGSSFSAGGGENFSIYYAGMVLDSNNGLYVSDMQSSRVLYFPHGSTTATIVYGQLGSFTNRGTNYNGGINTAKTLANPSGIALDKNGKLFISDSSNNRVLSY